MLNTITRFFGIGNQWLFQSRKKQTEVAPPQYFEVSDCKVAVDKISSIRIDRGFVQLDRAQEPTLLISLKKASADSESNTKHEMMFAGDQADKALDALASCGYLDDIDARVKKRVFLNARFDYQNDLSNLQVTGTYAKSTSVIH